MNERKKTAERRFYNYVDGYTKMSNFMFLLLPMKEAQRMLLISVGKSLLITY